MLDPAVPDHQDAVYNVVYRILGDSQQATLITQNTLSAAFRGADGSRARAARRWLLRAAIRQCCGRSQRPGSARPLAESNHDPCQACLQALPLEQRVVVVLSDLQGMSYREIAEVTGMPVTAVRARLSQGRSRLRDELVARDWPGEA